MPSPTWWRLAQGILRISENKMYFKPANTEALQEIIFYLDDKLVTLSK